ncbi:hypothetical protein Droror1_Dr00001305 [Drosera rotundifolia]
MKNFLSILLSMSSPVLAVCGSQHPNSTQDVLKSKSYELIEIHQNNGRIGFDHLPYVLPSFSPMWRFCDCTIFKISMVTTLICNSCVVMSCDVWNLDGDLIFCYLVKKKSL